MANILPLVVSGEIGTSQVSILMSVVNATPYYLVMDMNGTPYFQPLYQDPSTGLDVFSNAAARVVVTIGTLGAVGTGANINHVGDGPFINSAPLLRIVGYKGNEHGLPGVPIEPLAYKNATLVACGYQYVLTGGYAFYLTNTWSATPGAQAIASSDTATTFFVFPVDDLVGSNGKPAGDSVFSAIYNDVLGKASTTYLFSSYDAWLAGAGEPYFFSADSKCGPDGLGQCNGTYADCQRLKNSKFKCLVTVSWRCKVLALLPFLIPSVLAMIAFYAVLLADRTRHYEPGVNPRTARRNEIILLVGLASVSTILGIIMIALATANTDASNRYLRSVCRLTGEYQ